MTSRPADNGQSGTIGVVIVTYNSEVHIDGLAATLSVALGTLPHRVVVADNSSDDGTVARVRAVGYELVEMGGNLGYAAGLNAGLRRLTDARAVLILNPDIELAPDSVTEMLRVLDDPRVGIVVPQNRETDGTLALNQRRDPSLRRAVATALIGGTRSRSLGSLSEVVADESEYLRPHDIDWGVGAVMMISRACIDAVGEWDESFFLYSEETDYCQRARNAGYSVRYEPAAIAVHEGGGGVFQPRLRSMMAVNKVRLYHRQHGPVRSFFFWLAELMNETTRAVMGNDAARAAAAALLFPSRRPTEIRCSGSLLPR
jgi:N-acetylglucosaminyl-diphospho-decaprenol L-rhamnosyltransferase